MKRESNHYRTQMLCLVNEKQGNCPKNWLLGQVFIAILNQHKFCFQMMYYMTIFKVFYSILVLGVRDIYSEAEKVIFTHLDKVQRSYIVLYLLSNNKLVEKTNGSFHRHMAVIYYPTACCAMELFCFTEGSKIIRKLLVRYRLHYCSLFK